MKIPMIAILLILTIIPTTRATHSTASLWGITNIIGGLIVAHQRPKLENGHTYQPYVLISVASGVVGITTEKPYLLALAYPVLALGSLFFLSALSEKTNPVDQQAQQYFSHITTTQEEHMRQIQILSQKVMDHSYRRATEHSKILKKHEEYMSKVSSILDKLALRTFTLSEHVNSLENRIQATQQEELLPAIQATNERLLALETHLARVVGEIRALKQKEEDCSICTFALNPRQLNCDHVFHSNCIDQWFRQPAQQEIQTCPQCRAQQIFSTDLEQDAD